MKTICIQKRGCFINSYPLRKIKTISYELSSTEIGCSKGASAFKVFPRAYKKSNEQNRRWLNLANQNE